MKVGETLMVMAGMLLVIIYLSFRVHALKHENLALQGEVFKWQGHVPAIAEHRAPLTKTKVTP